MQKASSASAYGMRQQALRFDNRYADSRRGRAAINKEAAVTVQFLANPRTYGRCRPTFSAVMGSLSHSCLGLGFVARHAFRQMTQGSAERIQMCIVGAYAAGSSRVPAFTAIIFGFALGTDRIGDPQDPQNSRSIGRALAVSGSSKRDRSPFTVMVLARTMRFTECAAPDCFRQLVQWQAMTARGAEPIEYRTPPQMQPPVIVFNSSVMKISTEGRQTVTVY